MKIITLLLVAYLFAGATPSVNREFPIFEGLNFRSEKSAFQEPRFPGGEVAMNKFIQDNLVYPPESKAKEEEGVINISVTVTVNGDLTNVSTKDRRLFPALANEAMRVVKLMPRWRAAEANGRPCSVRIGFPVEFKITK